MKRSHPGSALHHGRLVKKSQEIHILRSEAHRFQVQLAPWLQRSNKIKCMIICGTASEAQVQNGNPRERMKKLHIFERLYHPAGFVYQTRCAMSAMCKFCTKLDGIMCGDYAKAASRSGKQVRIKGSHVADFRVPSKSWQNTAFNAWSSLHFFAATAWPSLFGTSPQDFELSLLSLSTNLRLSLELKARETLQIWDCRDPSNPSGRSRQRSVSGPDPIATSANSTDGLVPSQRIGNHKGKCKWCNVHINQMR